MFDTATYTNRGFFISLHDDSSSLRHLGGRRISGIGKNIVSSGEHSKFPSLSIQRNSFQVAKSAPELFWFYFSGGCNKSWGSKTGESKQNTFCAGCWIFGELMKYKTRKCHQTQGPHFWPRTLVISLVLSMSSLRITECTSSFFEAKWSNLQPTFFRYAVDSEMTCLIAFIGEDWM